MTPVSHRYPLRAHWSATAALCVMVAGLQSTFNPWPMRIESAPVTVPVTVRDAQGRLLSGLSAGSFKLYQDGRAVPVSLFLTPEDPMRIALLIDTSVSTLTALGKIKKAASRFLLQMKPQDLAMVVSFDTEVRVLCPFSSDLRALKSALGNAKAGGSGTRLRDAIQEVAGQRFRSVPGRKAIVLVTDGQDHGSQISAPDLLDAVAASGTAIYSVFYSVDPRELMKGLVGISSRVPKAAAGRNSGPYANEREEQAAQYLERISELSAGRFYRGTVRSFDDAFRQISQELRSQYLIGFYPDTSEPDGNMHSLVVGVLVPGAVVRSRPWYRAVP